MSSSPPLPVSESTTPGRSFKREFSRPSLLPLSTVPSSGRRGLVAASARPTTDHNRLQAGLWILVCLAVLALLGVLAPGWDFTVYRNAIRSLQLGHDPYLDNIRLQELAYSSGSTQLPFSYLYSPITLPVLRILGMVPVYVLGLLFWSVYVVAVLAELRIGMLFATARERQVFAFVAPVAVFFPGLLADGTVLSGNIAYVLYAAILLAAVAGWRHETWGYFYIVVLVASCVKAPFMVWVALPVLSARMQWFPASLTALAGGSLYCTQALMWPSLFEHYLDAIGLTWSLQHDFGCGPAGLFMQWRVMHHHSYLSAGSYLYLVYAPLLFAFLVYLSRRYLAGAFSLKEWAPVLLVGIALLNPRIIEYDAVPVTIPLALILWRVIVSCSQPKQIGIGLAFLLIVANAFGLTSWELHKMIDGPILIALFLAGSWHLLRSRARSTPSTGRRPSVY